jgi:1,4-dihydroxy-2-naphthoate polyprenyltransferase
MIYASTVRLLRLPFSVFLSPLFFFALSEVAEINWIKTLLVFVILHFLIYPASNAYNSYMDQDKESIGGLEHPPQPTRELYIVSILLDLAAISLSLSVDLWFAAMIPFYIAASKAYSWRKIRLKKYPVIGYLTVILFQGAFTFWLVYYGCSDFHPATIPWQGMLISTLLIGGFYPLTQIYQHQQDLDDGVKTISYKLGYTGTFIFSCILYLLAFLFMAQFFIQKKETGKLAVVGIFFIPVIVYFIKWFIQVKKDPSAADFRHTMRMNWIAAGCTNIAFIILSNWRWFE